jgi:DNA-binding GntR family transcriptional regulator
MEYSGGMAEADILQAPRREILSDNVYLQLKSLIMNGQVRPGERMNIEDLSRRLDVSPTPVREALARLESEELAIKLPLRGYTTTNLLDAGQIMDLYDLRLLLEVPSAGRAAAKLTDAQATLLKEELSSVSEAPEETQYESYRAFVDHDARLHQLILTIAGNEMVTRAFVRLHGHLHLYRLAYDGRFGEHSLTEHEHLVEALLTRDPASAEDAMRTHLTRARDRVLAGFEKQE